MSIDTLQTTAQDRLERTYASGEIVRDSEGVQVRRGTRVRDGFPVMIKLLSPGAPAHREREFRHDFSVAGSLSTSSAVKPLDLGLFEGCHALVVEDFGGVPLDEQLDGPMAVGEFLATAIRIAAAVEALHSCDLVHKNLKPMNILVHPSTGVVKIADFGLAFFMPGQRQPSGAPRPIAGSLPYMSPEHTGKVNRALDQRSDLYSLGVTFFEMVTGRALFSARDPLEWMHCHVALRPPFASDIVPAIPRVISEILSKLLAKSSEDRYQSARGLRHDLELSCRGWEQERFVRSFALGQRDIPEKLLVSQSLFGRDQELASLHGAFERVAESGSPELVMVSGYSGVGKTSLVRELQKTALLHRGFFAEGKFDCIKRDSPYSTLVLAFSELVQQLLSEAPQQISLWQTRLQAALGSNAQLIADVIPQISLLIGPQLPVPALPPLESSNRFGLVFRNFIGVFAQERHPLVLFLDDLQWADSASLSFVTELSARGDGGFMLVVGAYRSNEVSPGGSLGPFLNTLRLAELRVSELSLGPLSAESLQRLVSETLHRGDAEVTELRDIVLEKTQGNPFFSLRFLESLHSEHLITFDADTAQWRWDLAGIRRKGFTDNVIDFMAAKLERTDSEVRTDLQLLSCLGSSFDAGVTAVALGCRDAEVDTRLSEAVRSGFVLRAGSRIEFFHDKFQEAAYALIPPTMRAAEHLRIGRKLRSLLAGQAESEAFLFDVVRQLNLGVNLIDDAAESTDLRQLNLLAGKKAKAAVAFEAARAYLEVAVSLLPAQAWGELYQEAFTIHLELAESEYAIAEFSAADARFGVLLANAQSRIDRAKVYGLRVDLYLASGRYADALAVTLEALQLLDIDCSGPDSVTEQRTSLELARLRANLRGRSIAALADAPLLKNAEIQSAIELLASTSSAVYITQPDLYTLALYRALNLTLESGNCPESCRIFQAYGMKLVSTFGEIQAGLEFSEMALQLNEKFGDRKLRGVLLYLHGGHILLWNKHLAFAQPVLQEAFAACLEVGNFAFAGYAALWLVFHSLQTGGTLAEALTASEEYLDFARRSHNDALTLTLLHQQQFVRCLQGKTLAPGSFEDESFSEIECVRWILAAGFDTSIAAFHVLKQTAACIYGLHQEGLEAAEAARPFLHRAGALLVEAEHHFYAAVSLAGAQRNLTEDDGVTKAALAAKLEKLELWAKNCPETFHCRHALLLAELARLEGRAIDAMPLYDSAIQSAGQNGFAQVEGVANEAAARFYRDLGMAKVADVYLLEARVCYRNWGAVGKVKQLEQLYPQLREKRPSSASSTFAAGAGEIDLLSVVKASQVVSGELLLDRLPERLIAVVLEQVGAQVGFVLLKRDGALTIEAEARLGASRSLEVTSLPSVPAQDCYFLPQSILNYASRTASKVLLDNAVTDKRFSADPYVIRQRPRSILCFPVLRQAELIGLLYLENNLITGAFTSDHQDVLELLASQAAISLDNAHLYHELKLENEQRTSAEQRFYKVFNASPVPMSIIRFADLKYVDVNESHSAVLGITREESIGHTPGELRIMDEQYLIGKRDELLVHGRFAAEEVIFCTKAGEKRTFLLSIERIELSGEICALSAALDVTERLRAEEQLRQSQKMEALGRMASGVAHDFNNLLTAINGLSALALEELDPSHSAAELLREVVKSGDLAANLTRQLLAYGRKQQLAPRLWDLSLIASEMSWLVKRLLTPEIELVMVLRDDLSLVKVDRAQIEQLIMNLAVNARDAMPNGGKLTIETLAAPPDRVYAAAAHAEGAPGAQVVLAISDTGTGMPPEVQERLFEPFFTTKGPGRGTGLGLSVVYGIVQQSGGNIAVHSTVGVGTEFRIRFPEAPARVAMSGIRQAPGKNF